MIQNYLHKSKLTVLIILAFTTPLTYWPVSPWLVFPWYDLCFTLLLCLSIVEVFFSRMHIKRLTIREYILGLLIILLVLHQITRGYASLFIEMLVLFSVSTYSRFSQTDLEKVTLSLLAGGVGVAFLGLFQYFIGKQPATGSMANPNLLSGYLTLLLPLALSFWLHPKKVYKAVGVVSLGLLGLTLTATFTRAGYLSALVGLAGFALVKERKLIAVILACCLIFGLIVTPARGRFTQIDDLRNVTSYSKQIGGTKPPSTVSSLDSRLRLWSFAAQEFTENPWTGIGLGQFQNKLEEFITTHPSSAKFFTYGVEDVHNSYLRLLVETGIFGLLGFLLFLCFWMIPVTKLLWLNRTEYGPIVWGVFFGVVAYLMHNLTNSLLFRIPTSYAFWICLAILARYTVLKVEGTKRTVETEVVTNEANRLAQ